MNALRGFVAHGVIFNSNTEKEARGDCPFCHKENHLYVNIETRQFDCKRCGAHGGWRTFLSMISAMYVEAMDKSAREKLAIARELPVSAFNGLGIGWDGDMFTIPIFDELNAEGKPSICDIRRWKPPKGTMLSTPTAKTGMWNGAQLFNPARKNERVFVCEGEWDGIALQWLLCKLGEKGIVIAMPGANTFKREWVPVFAGRDVYTLYDNDEAGESGELLALERLTGTVKKLFWLHWPESLPSKFDVRDFIKIKAVKDAKPRAAFRELMALFNDHPRRRMKAHSNVDVPRPEPKYQGNATRDTVIAGYRKWLHVNDDNILDVLFGAVFANRLLEGDPIWLFLVAPPGGSKTELLMSLSKADMIETTTSLTPHALVSGMAWTAGADPSLIPKLDGKILVIKDFTTILKMHFSSRDEIFGILRDAYDGKTEKIFGTGVKRSYESRFGILAGVTPAIDSFSVLHASLGERFLKFRLDDPLIHTNEDETIRRALSNINKEVSMREQISDIACACLTREMPKTIPTIDNTMTTRIIALARVAAAMRGVVEREKYTGSVLYRPTSEIGTRLAKQLAKLGIGISLFRGEKTLNEYSYECVRRVALDTCPDRVEQIMRTMYQHGENGTIPIATFNIAALAKLPQATVYRLMADFELLEMVKRYGTSNKAEWMITPELNVLITKSGAYKPTTEGTK